MGISLPAESTSAPRDANTRGRFGESWFAASLRVCVAGVLGQATLLAVLGFAVCFLSPLMQSGYYADDTLNSCVRGYLRMREQNLGTYIGDYVRYYFQQGRFFPGALAITYTVHDVFASELTYKGFLLALILTNLLEFYYLLRCWKVNRAIAQLGTLALVLLLQMRFAADPLLSFAGILQVVAGQLLLSMICWQKYLETRRRAWLVGSLVIYTSSLVTYEISYFFLPIFFVMAYAHFRQGRVALSAVWGHALIVALLALGMLGLRFVHRPADSNYRPNLEPQAIARTAIYQASAALPLSYALLSEHRQVNSDLRRLVTRWDNVAVGVYCGLLTLLLLRKAHSTKDAERSIDGEPSLSLLAAAGLVIWGLPGVPIAASPRYQTLVQLGLGYLPVYVQYLGTSLLLVLGLSWAVKRFGWRSWPFVIVVNICVAMITFDANRQVVDAFEATPDLRDRRLLEAALDHGLADCVPAGATIMTTKFHPWLADGPPESSGFFAKHLRRKVNAVSGQPIQGMRTLDEQVANIPAPSFAVTDHCPADLVDGKLHDGRVDAQVILSSLESTAGNRPSPPFGARLVRVFIQREPTLGPRPTIGLRAQRLSAVDDPLASSPRYNASGESQVRQVRLPIVAQGRGWAIYEGRFSDVVDIATLSIVDSARTEAASGPSSLD